MCQRVLQFIRGGIRVQEASCDSRFPLVPVGPAQSRGLARPIVGVSSLGRSSAFQNSWNQSFAIGRCDVGKGGGLEVGAALVEHGEITVVDFGVVVKGLHYEFVALPGQIQCVEGIFNVDVFLVAIVPDCF